jgi:hypothetical protein
MFLGGPSLLVAPCLKISLGALCEENAPGCLEGGARLVEALLEWRSRRLEAAARTARAAALRARRSQGLQLIRSIISSWLTR